MNSMLIFFFYHLISLHIQLLLPFYLHRYCNTSHQSQHLNYLIIWMKDEPISQNNHQLVQDLLALPLLPQKDFFTYSRGFRQKLNHLINQQGTLSQTFYKSIKQTINYMTNCFGLDQVPIQKQQSIVKLYVNLINSIIEMSVKHIHAFVDIQTIEQLCQKNLKMYQITMSPASIDLHKIITNKIHQLFGNFKQTIDNSKDLNPVVAIRHYRLIYNHQLTIFTEDQRINAQKILKQYLRQNIGKISTQNFNECFDLIEKIMGDQLLALQVKFGCSYFNQNLEKQLAGIKLFNFLCAQNNPQLKQYFVKENLLQRIFHRSCHEQIIKNADQILLWALHTFHHSISDLKFWNLFADHDKRVREAFIYVLNKTIDKCSSKIITNILSLFIKMQVSVEIKYSNTKYYVMMIELIKKSQRQSHQEGILWLKEQYKNLMKSKSQQCALIGELQRLLFGLVEGCISEEQNYVSLTEFIQLVLIENYQNGLFNLLNFYHSLLSLKVSENNEYKQRIRQMVETNKKQIHIYISRAIKILKNNQEDILRLLVELLTLVEFSIEQIKQTIYILYNSLSNKEKLILWIEMLLTIPIPVAVQCILIIIQQAQTQNIFAKMSVPSVKAFRNIILIINQTKQIIKINKDRSFKLCLLPTDIRGHKLLHNLILKQKQQTTLQQLINFQIQIFTTQMLNPIKTRTSIWQTYIDNIFQEIFKKKLINSLINLLRLMKKLMTVSQMQYGLADTIPFFSQLKGQKVKLKVIHNQKRFEVEMKDNETLWRLKKRIAEQLHCDVVNICIFSNDQKLENQKNGESLKNIKMGSENDLRVQVSYKKAIKQQGIILMLQNKFFHEEKVIKYEKLIKIIANKDISIWLFQKFPKKPSFNLSQLLQLILQMFQEKPKFVEAFNKISPNLLELNEIPNHVESVVIPRKLLQQQKYMRPLLELILEGTLSFQIGKQLANFIRIIPLSQLFQQLALSLPNKFIGNNKQIEQIHKSNLAIETITICISKFPECFWKLISSNIVELIRNELNYYLKYLQLKQKYSDVLMYMSNLMSLFNLFISVAMLNENIKAIKIGQNKDMSKYNIQQLIVMMQNESKKMDTDEDDEAKKILIYKNEEGQTAMSLYAVCDIDKGIQIWRFLCGQRQQSRFSSQSMKQLSKYALNLLVCDQRFIFTLISDLQCKNKIISTACSNIIYIYFFKICHQDLQQSEQILNQLFNLMPEKGGIQVLNHFKLFSKLLELYHQRFKFNQGNFQKIAQKVYKLLQKHQSIQSNYDTSEVDYVTQGSFMTISTIFRLLKQNANAFSSYFINLIFQRYIKIIFQNQQQNYTVNCSTRKEIYQSCKQVIKYNPQFPSDNVFLKFLEEIQTSLSKSENLRQKCYPVGLINIKNICYLNSLLQSLFAIQPFVTCVCSLQTQDPLVLELQNIFIHLKLSIKSSYNIENFLLTFDPPINPNLQQDTTEFFSRLIQRLEKVPQLKSIIQYLFIGNQRTIIRCLKCKHQTQKDDRFLMLTLDVQKMQNIEQCFEKTKQQQIVSDFKCSHCYQKGDHCKSMVISRLPNILIVHFKRIIFSYQYMQKMKIHSRIQFGNSIKLSQIALNDKNSFYFLNSVIVHSGNGESGHYYTIKAKKQMKEDDVNKYWILNDAQVSEGNQKYCKQIWYGSNNEDLNSSSENAYVIFFQRKNKVGKVKVKQQEYTYENYPETLNKKIQDMVLSQNNALRKRQLMFGREHCADFLQFIIYIILLPQTTKKLQKIYNIMARIMANYGLSCNSTITYQQLKDQNYGQIIQTMQQYWDQSFNLLLMNKTYDVRMFSGSFYSTTIIGLYHFQKQFAINYIDRLLQQITNISKSLNFCEGYLIAIDKIFTSLQINRTNFILETFLSKLIQIVKIYKKNPNDNSNSKINTCDIGLNLIITIIYMKKQEMNDNSQEMQIQQMINHYIDEDFYSAAILNVADIHNLQEFLKKIKQEKAIKYLANGILKSINNYKNRCQCQWQNIILIVDFYLSNYPQCWRILGTSCFKQDTIFGIKQLSQKVCSYETLSIFPSIFEQLSNTLLSFHSLQQLVLFNYLKLLSIVLKKLRFGNIEFLRYLKAPTYLHNSYIDFLKYCMGELRNDDKFEKNKQLLSLVMELQAHLLKIDQKNKPIFYGKVNLENCKQQNDIKIQNVEDCTYEVYWLNYKMENRINNPFSSFVTGNQLSQQYQNDENLLCFFRGNKKKMDLQSHDSEIMQELQSQKMIGMQENEGMQEMVGIQIPKCKKDFAVRKLVVKNESEQIKQYEIKMSGIENCVCVPEVNCKIVPKTQKVIWIWKINPTDPWGNFKYTVDSVQPKAKQSQPTIIQSSSNSMDIDMG